MLIHPRYEQDNPFRQPWWRFDVVMYYANAKRRRIPAGDLWMRALLQFLRDYRLADEWPGSTVEAAVRERRRYRDRLFDRQPHVWFAYELHVAPDPWMRTIVQAGILARETDAHVAERIGTRPETIHWYEKLCFNVRDRMQARRWMALVIRGKWEEVNRSSHASTADRQRHQLIKAVAYHGGTHALDGVLGTYSSTGQPKSADEAPDWLNKNPSMAVKVRTLEAAYALPWNSPETLRAARLAMQRESEFFEPSKAPLEAAFKEMLNNIPAEEWDRFMAGRPPK